jgi:hypothetical protein
MQCPVKQKSGLCARFLLTLQGKALFKLSLSGSLGLLLAFDRGFFVVLSSAHLLKNSGFRALPLKPSQSTV